MFFINQESVIVDRNWNESITTPIPHYFQKKYFRISSKNKTKWTGDRLIVTLLVREHSSCILLYWIDSKQNNYHDSLSVSDFSIFFFVETLRWKIMVLNQGFGLDKIISPCTHTNRTHNLFIFNQTNIYLYCSHWNRSEIISRIFVYAYLYTSHIILQISFQFQFIIQNLLN